MSGPSLGKLMETQKEPNKRPIEDHVCAIMGPIEAISRKDITGCLHQCEILHGAALGTLNKI